MSISALAIKKVILPVTYNSNYHITKQVLALYRSKLRIASKMGYKIGSGAEREFINNTMFDDDKIHTYARKLYVGKITWSHIYYKYRDTIEMLETDYKDNEEIYNQALDYGFDTLRAYNKMKKAYDDENKYKDRAIAEKYRSTNPMMTIPKGSVIWDGPSG